MKILSATLQLIIAVYFFTATNCYAADVKNLIEELSSANIVLKPNNLLAKKLNQLDGHTQLVIKNVLNANQKTAELDNYNTLSTTYFKHAITAAEFSKRQDLILWTYSQYAFYLYTYRKYENLLPLFIKIIELIDVIDEQTIISPVETYKRIGYFLMTVGDNQKAIVYFNKALKHSQQNSQQIATIYDNLGLLYLNKRELKNAEKYFIAAKKIALANKDTLRYAKVLGNYAEIKISENNIDEAIGLLQQDINLSRKLKNNQNTIFAIIKLSKLYLNENKVKLANDLLLEAKKIAATKDYLLGSSYEINLLLVEIAKRTNDKNAELEARRNVETIKQSLSKLDGADVINKVNWELQKEMYQTTITAEKAKASKENLIKLFAIFLSIGLVIVIIFVIKRYRHRIQQDKETYTSVINEIFLEKEASEQKLKDSHQTLQSYTVYLKEKTKQIAYLEKEIEKAKEKDNIAAINHADQMQELLNAHFLNHDTWLSFKSTFINNYPVFYQHLTVNYPDLTESNLRLIFLQKLDLNNLEIARILGLTVEAVKKAKQRLKKKYMDKYEFLFQPENSL